MYSLNVGETSMLIHKDLLMLKPAVAAEGWSKTHS